MPGRTAHMHQVEQCPARASNLQRQWGVLLLQLLQRGPAAEGEGMHAGILGTRAKEEVMWPDVLLESLARDTGAPPSPALA